jgi:hypothetical protein
MPAAIMHSATVAHSAIDAIQTSLMDSSTIGYVASALVLAAFGMKDMVNLRIVAICSNIAFIAYGIALNLLPVLILHVILLPLNGWRLMGTLKQRSATVVAENLQHDQLMAPDLQNDAFFSAAIEGLPKVVELIVTVPEEKRSLALTAAHRSYLQTAQALGYDASDAQQWASTIMSLVEIAAVSGEWPANMTAINAAKGTSTYLRGALSPPTDRAPEPKPTLVQFLSGLRLPLPAPAEQT